MEEPLNLAAAVSPFGAGDVVVVDCLTLWLSNWLCRESSEGWSVEFAEFLQTLEKTQADLLLVTNEVGMGVVPLGKLSRDFVDLSGRLHQEIARLSDRVTLMHFGLPTVIKDSMTR